MANKFHFAWGSIAAVCLAGIYACGDSDGGANTSTNAETAALDEVYASEDDLPGCTEKYEGAVAFVKDGSAAFKCEDGRWENKGEYYANNDAIKNCTEKREGEIAYIVDEDKSLVCQDGKWVKTENASNSSNSRNDEKGAISSSSSSWSETIESSSSSRHSGLDPESSSSVKTPGSSSAEESLSSVASSSSFIGCKTAEVDNCEYGEILDERDGKKYKTVKIGDQWWMAKNLAFEYKVDEVSYGTYVDETYGVFYNWPAAMDYAGLYSDNGKGCLNKGCSPIYPVRGICPENWHLPEKVEWETLFSSVGENPYALQANGFDEWSGASDSYGFSIFPYGYFYGKSLEYHSQNCAAFWTASKGYYTIYYANSVKYGNGLTADGNYLSVRCVKD